jgi:hypothetical protein
MKKVGLLVLVLVMALGAIGVGYAYWTQPVTVTASVDMGNLEAQITEVTEGVGDGNGASLSAVPDNTSPDDGVELSITATQIYPGWTGVVNFKITNTGTMPIKLTTTGATGTTADLTFSAPALPGGTINAGVAARMGPPEIQRLTLRLRSRSWCINQLNRRTDNNTSIRTGETVFPCPDADPAQARSAISSHWYGGHLHPMVRG